MQIGYDFGYLAEAELIKLALYLGSGGLTSTADRGLLVGNAAKLALKETLKTLKAADLDYVLLRFLS